MKKFLAIAAAVVAVLYIVLLLIGQSTMKRFEESRPVGEVISPSGRLVCSYAAYMDYVQTSLKIANALLQFYPYLESEEDVDRLLAAFDALELDGPETTFVAAHIPTGDTYTHTCEEEPCSERDALHAWSECREATLGVDLGGYCIELAVRFREQDHCLIAPFQGDQ
ncbi:hypothetical protein [Roseinatronobacter monicus]|uniref:Uncharacterized protein n=1 Tax=Roseinatronobacter monicus TaxID=393481 RepID=A0A543KG64_9RHOB|nr:hypothetical protein [Roseinatronobacter monicus]TQM94078.1 hypothetical protein BD293_2735 [Roseinatronobacter monicus]